MFLLAKRRSLNFTQSVDIKFFLQNDYAICHYL